MSRRYKIIFGIFIALIAVLTYVEANQPEPVNWFPSYSKDDKIPLGTYALFESLKSNPNISLEELAQPPFEILQDSTFAGTYLFINGSVNFDKAETKRLMTWVNRGNDLVVISNSPTYNLLDTLDLINQNTFLYDELKEQPMLELSNPKLKQDLPYLYDRDTQVNYFEEMDTLNTTVLGITQLYSDTLEITSPKVNFIEIAHGDGRILIHLFPKAFSNYFLLLEENRRYAEAALSYLDTSKTIYWDNHYKSGKPVQTSLLYLLLNNKNLKWAYYLLIIATILFVIFEGKRKQRPIKIVTPLSNRTFDYTKTIAGMYLDKNDHLTIVNKQITLFLEYVRNQLRIPTIEQDTQFFKALSERTGQTLEDTKALFNYLDAIKRKAVLTKTDVVEVNQRLSEFKTR